MRIYTTLERAFVTVIGALMLWSAPHWASDGLSLWRSKTPNAVAFSFLAALLVLIGSILLYVGIRGRAPRWADRFSVPRQPM
jgi:hypothetical protein